MRPLAVAAGVICLLTGCDLLGESDSSGTTSGAETAAIPTIEAPDPVLEQRVEIYSAVIRDLATHGSLSRGFEVIYVLDGPVRGLGNPRTSFDPEPPRERFGVDFERAILWRLDYLPVRFVSRRNSVITAAGVVQNRGALVMVGPIARSGERARVAGHRFVAGLGAVWIRYSLRERAAGWTVTRANAWAVS